MSENSINPNFYKSPLGVVYEKNPKIKYPVVYAVFLLSSHNTSYLYCRENGTYYWEHCRKSSDKIKEEAHGLQLDLFRKPILSKDFIMKAILAH